ncbi:MAG: hypothetical protein COW88_03580 [Candidatus Lloydbacteria bacterium CG22_combo_CG10-13_8_21_14_all_47_15]|uniref:Uncharacterized protein n=1 Tax=Candidatus Lloydbacteria bacterium CG22_combo_CG10-13_8_21_14_all_47_15 TaxID=1974635 RepID=A0A2H0CSV5_9BACT|nr:MAG: hypothetical protein COW88_03580 [Candidatus Lloydbacteria bacterium CG22_combo_CG10-13_8_21_14_all_47_15]
MYMQVSKRIIAYGVLVFLISFLGFPASVRIVFFAVLGIVLVSEGYLMRSSGTDNTANLEGATAEMSHSSGHADSFPQNEHTADSSMPRV